MSSIQVCQVSVVIISDQCKAEHLELRQEEMWLAFNEGFTAGSVIGLIALQTQPNQIFSSKPRETKTQEFMTSHSNPKRILISTQYMNHNT
jgi:hypothetical protein